MTKTQANAVKVAGALGWARAVLLDALLVCLCGAVGLAYVVGVDAGGALVTALFWGAGLCSFGVVGLSLPAAAARSLSR